MGWEKASKPSLWLLLCIELIRSHSLALDVFSSKIMLYGYLLTT